MRLSEWMELHDEVRPSRTFSEPMLIPLARLQTKNSFVARVQKEVFGGCAVPSGHQFTAETIRKNYETGVWSAPCYALQCVGYSRRLYNGLHYAAARVGTTLAVPP